jgi:DNA-binding FadR family transcriptional regulator
VLETRIALERAAAEGAADRASEKEIGVLRELVAAMEGEAIPPAAFHDRDTEFHVAIGKASCNQMLIEDWDDVARKLCRQHGKIVDAIDAKQPEEAGKLVVSHITGFYKRAGFIS